MRVSIFDSSLDIAQPSSPVEIEIREDGKVLWVNIEGKCVLHVCRIENGITINGKGQVLNVG